MLPWEEKYLTITVITWLYLLVAYKHGDNELKKVIRKQWLSVVMLGILWPAALMVMLLSPTSKIRPKNDPRSR